MSETEVIRVRYWAAARAAAGTAEDAVGAAGPMTLADVISEVARRHPGSGFADVLSVCSILVGDAPVGSRSAGDVTVLPGSTVEFLPPFAGG